MPLSAEQSLETGLTALKQGDYQTAKATLEALTTHEGNRLIGLQAQIGLVVAYGRTGEITKALAVCETLAQSPNSQVKQWAERSLEQLTKRHKSATPSQTETDILGFAPFEHSVVAQNSAQIAQQEEQSQIQDPGSLTSSSLSSDPSSLTTITPCGKTKPLTVHWQYAAKAKTWQPLDKLNPLPLRLLIVATFMTVFWVSQVLLLLVLKLSNWTLVKLPLLEPVQFFYRDLTGLILLILVLLTCASPWLLDQLLTKFYGQRPFSREALTTHSPEAVRVLHRYCQQRGWQFPKLGLLPIAAPIALTYGNLPRTARIVVSQGLLDQLVEDEIATIYANELGHIVHWDFLVMSIHLLVTIPIYKLYQQLSLWADRTQIHYWRYCLGIVASFVYGVWCLLTGTGFWLSQLRFYYSDRFAAELTGHPNGLVRALLKIAIGISEDIQKQEQTSWQIESLNLLAPVGYEQSMSLGSVAPHTIFESYLMWDYLNPYRWWFLVNNSHPLIGDRLQRLSAMARQWHLATEIDLATQEPLRIKRQNFFIQIAPFLGIPLGIIFAGLIWLLWQLAYNFKLLNLKWIYDDWSYVIGCLFVGFSIGTLIRMGSFFPDIKPDGVQTDDQLTSLLSNPSSLPIDSIGVSLMGKLIGRRGVSNFLGQDLILQSSKGLIKLHHISWLGQKVNPQDFIGRQITIRGWLRRGATPWIDLQTLQTRSGQTVNSPHPIWSTVLVVAAEVVGAYLLLVG